MRLGFRDANDIGLIPGNIAGNRDCRVYLVYLINRECENGIIEEYGLN